MVNLYGNDMRVLQKNKQRMFYSLYTQSTPVYEKDENGETKYIEVDGEQVPIEVGTKEPHYGKPVEFYANISSKLNELHAREWGVDQSSIYSTLVVPKGYLPLIAGMLIWRTTPIEWEDEENEIPDSTSADYTVCGIMDEGLTTDSLLLQRISNNSFVQK